MHLYYCSQCYNTNYTNQYTIQYNTNTNTILYYYNLLINVTKKVYTEKFLLLISPLFKKLFIAIRTVDLYYTRPKSDDTAEVFRHNNPQKVTGYWETYNICNCKVAFQAFYMPTQKFLFEVPGFLPQPVNDKNVSSLLRDMFGQFLPGILQFTAGQETNWRTFNKPINLGDIYNTLC